MQTSYKEKIKSTDKKHLRRKSNHSLNRLVDIFHLKTPLSLDCGSTLADVRIAYETYGKLNTDASNAVLICHALTGSANVAGEGDFPSAYLRKIPRLRSIHHRMPGWWNGLIGPGKLFDTDKYLPQETIDEWFEIPPEPISVKNRHLINVSRPIGINSVVGSLRNASHDLRGTIACPKIPVCPWRQSTIEPDFNVKSMY